MREPGPFRSGKKRCQILFDGHWIGVRRPSQSTGESADVGIDGDAWNAEGVAKNHIRGFPTDPGQPHEIGQTVGHLAAVFQSDHARQAHQMFGLAAIETGWSNDVRHLGDLSAGEFRAGGVAGEQRRRHLIYAGIGALCTEHRGDEQLQRCGEVQFAMGVRIGHGEHSIDPAGAPHQG